jgi:hypothetical protein
MQVDLLATAVTFAAHFCGIATARGVCMFNILALSVSKSAAAPSGTDDEEAARAYFGHFMRFASSSCVAMLGRGSSEVGCAFEWDDVCLALSVGERDAPSSMGLAPMQRPSDSVMMTKELDGDSAYFGSNAAGEDAAEAEAASAPHGGGGAAEGSGRRSGQAGSKMALNMFIYKSAAASLMRLGLDV